MKSLYVKTPNVVFARHLLATIKQEAGQSLDNFLLTLTQLSKDCNFANVSSEEYRKEMIRDAFINGISSHTIRQRLLENNELTLERAFEQARTLDSAQKSSEVYTVNGHNGGTLASTSTVPDVTGPRAPREPISTIKNSTLAATNNVSKLCYFCGRTYHSRSNCPAKNAVCYKCNKKGHFSVVCKTKINNNASACMYNSNLCAIRPAPDCLARRFSTYGPWPSSGPQWFF